jgi:hypothetical protein
MLRFLRGNTVRSGRTVSEALVGDAIIDMVMATVLYAQLQRLAPLNRVAPHERKFGRTVLA